MAKSRGLARNREGIIADELGRLLLGCWRAGVAAADPVRVVGAALGDGDAPDAPVHVIAVGKAAPGMAAGAAAWLAERGVSVRGGVVIGADPAVSSHPVTHAAGDHPVPGRASAAAADLVSRAAAAVGPGDEAWVLLSGGASSLIAAPRAGLAPDDFSAAWDRLLRAGLDIAAMNAARRRLLRWGDGRLAAALATRRVRVLAISDVPGDDPSVIGSGPCSPAPAAGTAALEAALRVGGVWTALPPAAQALLREEEAFETGRAAQSPVRVEIIASSDTATAAAADHARAAGWRSERHSAPLVGDAAAAGVACAARVCTARGVVHVWGGETTVSLPDVHGVGGRCQELALAAAGQLALEAAGSHGGNLALLAAGSDGRDGPTDAAGALVDGGTWQRIAASGRDPHAALAAHDAYPALDAAGALLRTGPTGTNVMDLVIAAATNG